MQLISKPIISQHTDIDHLICPLIEETTAIMQSVLPKSCDLYPVPTTILKQHIEVIAPSIQQIVNKSLSSGNFSNNLKTAFVRPLLRSKKWTQHSKTIGQCPTYHIYPN